MCVCVNKIDEELGSIRDFESSCLFPRVYVVKMWIPTL